MEGFIPREEDICNGIGTPDWTINGATFTKNHFLLRYQKFEYAIGHWLQKSTEHVMGCVLCSPGCFSLFRGKAVMDENVMRTYTTVSTEPRHFVQYDQVRQFSRAKVYYFFK